MDIREYIHKHTSVILNSLLGMASQLQCSFFNLQKKNIRCSSYGFFFDFVDVIFIFQNDKALIFNILYFSYLIFQIFQISSSEWPDFFNVHFSICRTKIYPLLFSQFFFSQHFFFSAIFLAVF